MYGDGKKMVTNELEGNTLTVYAYIVRADKPVGTRDVTRGANLSSTSVAHRHLQKLENLGLIEKNSYGDYILKEKASINGYVWVGKNLVPRLMFYSFFFMSAFATEVSMIQLSFVIKRLVIETSFLFLTVMTLISMILFTIEWLTSYRKLNPRQTRGLTLK
jgi:repressor of nif and glnA expression